MRITSVVIMQRERTRRHRGDRRADRAEVAERGVPVEVTKLRDVTDLGRYDAFVVGSGIYLGTWLKGAGIARQLQDRKPSLP